MLGHNNPPPEEREWAKRFFHMPMEEAEAIIALLKYLKKGTPENYGKMHKVIDDRLEFFRKKMK